MPKIAAKDSNKNVTIAPHGTGKVVVGTGAADATLQSDGDFNLVLQTGNSTTGKIEIEDGANGNIDITPNGTGEVDISKVDIDGGTVDGITLGTNSAVTEAQIDNLNIDGNAITSTDTNGNIDLTPAGTGEVNISKVDIDSGAIDGATIATSDVTVGSGKTLDVSAGSLTTSTAQKQAVVDGADITSVGIVTSGTISTGAVIDDPTMTQGSDATGDVYYRAASGKLTRLATGADGTILTSTGAGAVPAFEAGGKVLQVEQFTSQASYVTTTADAWDDTAVLKAVTPKATTSRFLVELSAIASSGGDTWVRTGMKATGDSISTTAFGVDDDTPLSRSSPGAAGVIVRIAWNIIVDLDQSNIEDAITFTVWMNSGTPGVQVYLGSRNGVAGTMAWTFLTVTEIAS